MQSLLTVEQLLDALNGQCICYGNVDSIIFSCVATDSRAVVENTLFVPLMGEFQNGHKYIPQAVEKGASVVLINKAEYESKTAEYDSLAKANEKVCFILVENTLHGLQAAAEAYVAQFPNLVKISITGSCGKTTTKEMLVSVFKAKYGDKVVYTQGNFNSETGLPLSVFNIRKNHEYGIFEMGMNRVDEIGEISKVLKSEYGIITNIGTAHIGILGSQEKIAEEKRKSFRYISEKGAAFVPASDAFADFCCQGVKGKIVKYGESVDSSKSGVTFISDEGLFGTKFSVDGQTVTLPLSGRHNFENALGVIALAKECGIETKYIKTGLEGMAKLNGRMEIDQAELKNGSKVYLVKDCYNANPDSMEKVIEFVGGVKNVNKKIFVLADMKELGEKSKAGHELIGKALSKNEYDLAILVGPEMKYGFEVLGGTENKKNYYFEEKSNETFKQIVAILLEVSKTNDVIVFKGSHSMELEKIIPEVCKNEE
ncbi:MAG: UDP-N-acetylmuramoyl-tripeptide--D-alanyl-D-alanine ligase [Treponema sp.]|nr:UDP-N-acetylmuramoyl-tripeptide--D-alanyl-D-alanine ligase [Treponema sp.]